MELIGENAALYSSYSCNNNMQRGFAEGNEIYSQNCHGVLAVHEFIVRVFDLCMEFGRREVHR